MSLYMEMSYFIEEGAEEFAGELIPTGIGATMKTDALTRADFESRRSLAVPLEQHPHFSLDLWDEKEGLVDSIPLSDEGFRTITGEEVDPERYRTHYRALHAQVVGSFGVTVGGQR